MSFEVEPLAHPLLVGEAGDFTVVVPVPSAIPFVSEPLSQRTAASVGLGQDFDGVRVDLSTGGATDTTVPSLVAVEAVSPTEVDACFSEPVQLRLVADVEAFSAADWTFVGDVRMRVLSGRHAGAFHVRLTVTEMRQGQSYTLRVARDAVTDLALNILPEDQRTASFVGVGGAPTIARVERLTATRLRAHFSEPMALNTALRSPGSYAVSSTDGGASVFVGKATPDPFAQNRDEPAFVDLDVSEQTAGKTYLVTPRLVTDAAGNVVSGASPTFIGRGDPPTIKRVVAVSKNRVDVIFDKPVRVEARVLDPATYTWDDDALTTLSVLGVAGDRVKLVVTDQAPGVVYTLRIPAVVIPPTSDRFVIAGGGATGNNWSFGAFTLAKHTASTLQTWVAKLDTQTNEYVWATKWAETGLDSLITGAVVDRDDGSVYVGGYVRQNVGVAVDFFDKNSQSVPVASFTFTGPKLNGFLTKYDKDGNHVWTRGFHSLHPDQTSGCVPYGVTILPNGHVVLGFYDARVNSFTADARIVMFDGVTSVQVAAPSNAGFTSAVGPIVEVDASGSFVRSRLMELTAGSGSPANYVNNMSRRADNGVAVAGYGLAANGDTVTYRFGLGEAGAFTPTVAPSGGNRSFAANLKLDETDLHLVVAADETVGNNSRNVIANAAVCDEDGALYSVGIAEASGGADTLTAHSDRWTAPSVTHAFMDTAGRQRPYYAKRDAAGVAQWVKGAGSSSVTTANVEGVADCDAVGGKPFIAGHAFTGAPKLVLDQGLASEVTIDAGTSPFPRLWFAKLNKSDGTIAYSKRINASANASVISENGSKLAACGTARFVVAVPSFNDSASLILGAGEVNEATVSAIAGAHCAVVGLYEASDGSLIQAKVMPDAMGTVGNMTVTALNSSPL